MTRRIQILSAVLVVQIGLAVSLAFVGRSSGAFRSGEKLIGLDLASLDEIVIQDEGDPALVIQRKDGSWILPDHFGFPVSRTKLDRVTGTLFGIRKTWPVGTTDVAAKRFKVTDDDFERKITFRKGQADAATLLIGTSPGFKKVHARLAGKEPIYAIDFSAYEASVKPQDWEDKDLLDVDPDGIVRVEMDGIHLIRNGDALTVGDLGEGQETDPGEVSKLLSKLSKPTFLDVLGTEDKPEYRQDSPALTYTLEMKSGEAVDYTYSQLQGADDFVLKTSSHPEYFKTSKYAVESLQEFTRDKLVRAKQEPESAERPSDDQAGAGSQAAGVTAGGAGPKPASSASSPRPGDS
jgi:hypothetical protein